MNYLSLSNSLLLFSTKGEGLENVKKDKLSWVCNDEDVQFCGA